MNDKNKKIIISIIICISIIILICIGYFFTKDEYETFNIFTDSNLENKTSTDSINEMVENKVLTDLANETIENKTSSNLTNETTQNSQNQNSDKQNKKILIHVTGEVNNPRSI